ncbi:MAG TPA: DCC1-like thiol-disulfide oxidoreductase family protein [Planctomycetaceae bacterium]
MEPVTAVRERVRGDGMTATGQTRSADLDELPVEPAVHPVLFFDGVCGLCDATVNWLLRRDRAGVLRFAPLQGETAARVLPPADSQDLRSVVLVDAAGVHRRSAAVVRTLQHLGGRYRVYARLLWLVPGPLRELGYKAVSKVRYRLFGKKDLCRLPKPGESERFLP